MHRPASRLLAETSRSRILGTPICAADPLHERPAAAGPLAAPCAALVDNPENGNTNDHCSADRDHAVVERALVAASDTQHQPEHEADGKNDNAHWRHKGQQSD